MKVLLDHNLPRQLKPLFLSHEVCTAREPGWDALKNGALLAIAERERFDVMLTGDQNLSYQQNDLKWSISPVVLLKSTAGSWLAGKPGFCSNRSGNSGQLRACPHPKGIEEFPAVE